MNYYLKYKIGIINFAAPIEEVREIVRPKEIQKEEKLTKNIVGFFTLRGKRVVLFDLPKFLDINTEDSFEVIISEIEEKYIGFKVDKVFGILGVEELIPFPEIVEPKDYFRGVIKENKSFLQVLSFTKLLSGARLSTIKKYL